MIDLSNIFSLLNKKQKNKYFFLILFMTIATLLEVACLSFAYALIKIFIKGELIIESTYLKKILFFVNFENQENMIMHFSLVLFALYLVKFLFQLWTYHSQNKFIYGLKATISSSLFRRYLDQNFLFFIRKNSSELIRNIREECNMFAVGVMQSLTILFTELILILGIVCFLFYINFNAAFFASTFFLIIFYLYFRTVKNIFFQLGQKRQVFTFINLKRVTEMIQGIKDIKLYKSENYYFNIFNNLNFKLSKISRILTTLNQVPKLGFEILLITMIVIFILNMKNLGFDPKSSLELIGLFALAAFRILPSTSKILVALQQMKFHKPSVNLLTEEFKLQNKIENNKDKFQNYEFKFTKEIMVNNLSFNYERSKKNVLEKISINIKKNEIIGIVGKSGSGKSTFLDLLVGLLKPSNGSIKVDNIDISDGYESWQKKIGYISQNVHILDDTLKNNILFGSDLVSEKKIFEVLKIVQLDNFVQSLPDGINTVLGEMGSQISGGQSQRLSIARCLYRDPEILIFDEATSALDIDTENEILKIFKEKFSNKTIIMVSHRENTMKICNKFYYLDDGYLKINTELN